MIRETFVLTVRNLLDEIDDKDNILINAMELMEELYALTDRPSRYRRRLIREWNLASEKEEIEALSEQLSNDLRILQFLDHTIERLVKQGRVKYKPDTVS